jgi:hypothetical protein
VDHVCGRVWTCVEVRRDSALTTLTLGRRSTTLTAENPANPGGSGGARWWTPHGLSVGSHLMATTVRSCDGYRGDRPSWYVAALRNRRVGVGSCVTVPVLR